MKRGRWLISDRSRKRGGILCLTLSVWLLASCSLPRRARYLSDAFDPQPTPVGWAPAAVRFRETQLPALRVSYPQLAEEAEFVHFDKLCMTCHETYAKTFQHNVHRGQQCEDCHGPASEHLRSRGRVPGKILNFKKLKKAEASEVCLKCHEKNNCEPTANWRTSVHAHRGVACIDCHTAHYNVPAGTPKVDGKIAQYLDSVRQASLIEEVEKIEEDPSPPVDQAELRAASNHLGAIAPQVCYSCHGEMAQYQHLAHPHQILGKNRFSCETCHNPHGNIRPETRTDLCLQCHKNAPTMAWHSSTHSLAGVACTDCHNPHPSTAVQGVVQISHTHIDRPKRMPMAVQEPQACYKCHPKVFAENSMPSHHPIKEGKIVCSDCHDGHGQAQGNLREPTLNQVCWRCHADKQGPFAYEHPPVTQDCAICHAPHGSVANNLLHQPATFLCLRCHTGHRVGPTSGAHSFAGLPDVGNDVGMQQGFFTDCTQCHAQVHGSDLPSPNDPHALLR